MKIRKPNRRAGVAAVILAALTGSAAVGLKQPRSARRPGTSFGLLTLRFCRSLMARPRPCSFSAG